MHDLAASCVATKEGKGVLCERRRVYRKRALWGRDEKGNGE